MPRPPSRSAPTAQLAEAAVTVDPGRSADPGHHVEVAGTRTHVRVTPSGDGAEPALFVHGLGGSALNWTDLAGALAHRLDVHAIDLPGHGLSGPPPRGRYSPNVHAGTVIAYLEQSGRGPVHLVGNSMGGAVSILVAARRPDLVRTLTLISPAVPDNRPRIYPLKNNPRMALLAVPALGEMAVRAFNSRYAPEARAKGTIMLCFADRSRFPEQRMRELVAEMREREALPHTDAAMLRSMRSLARSQLLRGRRGWAAMRRIQAPTLVLWGDTDRLVAPDLAPYVAAAIDDSRLLVLDDVGHTAMMENPAATARAMLGLLDDAATRD